MESMTATSAFYEEHRRRAGPLGRPPDVHGHRQQPHRRGHQGGRRGGGEDDHHVVLLMADGGLPVELEEWIADVTGGGWSDATPSPRRREPARRGRSTSTATATRPELFLLRDTGRGGGSSRDAAVLGALAATDVPVPQVHGADAGLRAVLLERVPGRSDFPAVDDEREREPTAAHLMEVTAALHRLDPADARHRPPPGPGPRHRPRRGPAGVARGGGGDGRRRPPPALPLGAGLAAPPRPCRRRAHLARAQRHGPGQLPGRPAGGSPRSSTGRSPTGATRWRTSRPSPCATWPRRSATSPTRYAEYEAAGGPTVDLARGRVVPGARAGPELDADRTRARVRRPGHRPGRAHDVPHHADAGRRPGVVRRRRRRAPRARRRSRPAAPTDELRLVAHAWRDQRDTRRARAHRRRRPSPGPRGGRCPRCRRPPAPLRRRPRAPGARRADRSCWASARLRRRRAGGARACAGDADRENEVVAFFARHLVRESMLLEPLLGELADRHPQRLEPR